MEDVVVSVAIYCPTIAPQTTEDRLAPTEICTGNKLVVVDGCGAPSFSSLVNRCWREAFANPATDVCIVMSDRVQPTQEHVEKTCELISRGFALVGLYRFAFFGVTRDTIDQVGWMDEKFIGGFQEDSDYIVRCCEANVAVIERQEVPYQRGESRWNHEKAMTRWASKWKTWTDGPNFTAIRLLPEDPPPKRERMSRFLPWSRSQLIVGSGETIRMGVA